MVGGKLEFAAAESKKRFPIIWVRQQTKVGGNVYRWLGTGKRNLTLSYD